MTRADGSTGAGATGAGGGKTVLFAWELGMGLGHLMQMLPLARNLWERGHTVVVALRQLERAADVFGRAGVFYLPAPHKSAAPPRFPRALAYGQFLANVGFGDDDELFALACAWRNLIRSVGPDLIVCDHAPTALLAARALPEMKRVVIGSGFCVPPAWESVGDETARPRAPLRPAAVAADPAPALAVEAEVLSRVDWLLENWGEPPLEKLSQLSADVDETFLTTFPELDHFRDRSTGGRAASGTRYWGPVLGDGNDGRAEAPQWPDGSGPRGFAYFKAMPAASDVLAALKSIGWPAVAYVDGLGAAGRKALASPTLHLGEKRVDVAKAAAG